MRPPGSALAWPWAIQLATEITWHTSGLENWNHGWAGLRVEQPLVRALPCYERWANTKYRDAAIAERPAIPETCTRELSRTPADLVAKQGLQDSCQERWPNLDMVGWEPQILPTVATYCMQTTITNAEPLFMFGRYFFSTCLSIWLTQLLGKRHGIFGRGPFPGEMHGSQHSDVMMHLHAGLAETDCNSFCCIAIVSHLQHSGLARTSQASWHLK